MVVLLILAGVWAVVLVPPYLRSRSEGRPAHSISSFRQHLSTLERAAPGARGGTPMTPMGPGPMAVRPRPAAPLAGRSGATVPVGRAEVRKRRRDILFTLAGAALITFVLALALGGVAILFHLAADALLGGYVYLLVQLRRAATERQAKVRYLAPAGPARAEPALLLRRSAGS